MSERDAFDRILASFHDARIDDTHWLQTFTLMDDACRTKGDMLTFAEGCARDEIELPCARSCFRGEHNRELERKYVDSCLPWDERIPRFRTMPDSQILHVPVVCAERKRRTSPPCEDVLHGSGGQNGPSMRRDRALGSLHRVEPTVGAERRRRARED